MNINKIELISRFKVVKVYDTKPVLVSKLDLHDNDIIEVKLPIDETSTGQARFITITNLTRNIVLNRYSLKLFSNFINPNFPIVKLELAKCKYL